VDAHAPLLGAVDEEQTTKRPERLAAERGLRLLVEQQHSAPGVAQLGGGDEPGEAGSDDDHVRAAAAAAGCSLRQRSSGDRVCEAP
jgi:hypothetical protein